MGYKEPTLTFLVLDYIREAETRKCLESVRIHVKFPHKVIYLHNGPAEYPRALLAEGLVDYCVQTKLNNGLCLGTRDLFGLSFSPYSCYLQNDQFFKRDFTAEEFESIVSHMGASLVSPDDKLEWSIASVDIAGGWCGHHIYSDRAFIMPTDFYKKMENMDMLGTGGPGPHYGEQDRERPIQNYYKANRLLHFTYPAPLVGYGGNRMVRENPDGSIWEQRFDTNELRLVSGPIRERAYYPFFTDTEWEQVLAEQSWPEWRIPEKERANSVRWENSD